MADERGSERREVTQDANSQAAASNVAISSVPQSGIITPRGRQGAEAFGRDVRMMGQLASIVGGEIQELAEKKFAQDRVAGQIAFQQGKSYDELESEGASPHTVAGYRLMDAQTSASAMFQEQVAALEAVDYELTPDEFRETLNGRLTATLDGKDAATTRLITELAVQQMPKLAEMHVAKHQEFLSRQTFRSLSDAVSQVSMDPTSQETLKFMASGQTGSPAASMSGERREEAVVNGVQKAFANDNPMAFSILDRAGAFKKLKPEHRAALNGAKASYEARTRRKFDADYTNAVRATTRAVQLGKLPLNVALEQLEAANAARGWDMTNADVGGLYQADEKRLQEAARLRQEAIDDARLKVKKSEEGRQNLAIQLELDEQAERLRKGEIEPAEYITAVSTIIEGTRGHLTSADGNAIAGTIDARRTAERKAIEQKQADLEAAQTAEEKAAAKAALADNKATAEIAYSKLMRKPRADYEAGNITTAEFDQAQLDAMAASGLSKIAAVKHIKAADGRVVSRVVSEAKKIKTREAEDIAIQTAMARDMLVALPENLQQRAFQVKRAELQAEYAEQLADPATAEQAQASLQEDMLEFTANAGIVDKRMRSQINASLGTAPISPDGKATTKAVAAFNYLSQLKKENPALAERYLASDNAALFQMAETLQASGAGSAAEALEQASMTLQNGTLEEVEKRLRTPEVQELITETTSDWISNQSIGVFGAIFDSNSELQQVFDVLGTDESKLAEQSDRINTAVRRQAVALMARTPGLGPEDAVKLAGPVIEKRAAVLGSDLIMVPPGQNIRELMFGDRAGDFDMTAVPNNALMHYLREFGGTDKMFGEDFNNTNLWSVTGTLLFGSDEELADLVDTQLRGVPELKVIPDHGHYGADAGVLVHYKRADGTFNPVGRHIKYKDLGDLWISKQINRLD
jgi:hypothetical protein